MTQDVSTQTTVMERSSDLLDVEFPPTVQPANDADHLMDEIFGEVEQVLDGSLVPPDEPVPIVDRPDINFDIAAALAERYPQLAEQLEDANAPDLPGDDAELSKLVNEPQAKAESEPSNRLSMFERFMIFSGCASAVAALAVWLVSQGLITRTANFVSRKLASPNQVVTTPKSSVDQADLQFSEYMLRSLAAIDRDTAANPQILAAAPSTIKSEVVNTLPKAESNVKLPAPKPTELKLSPAPNPAAAQSAAKPTAPKPVIEKPVAPQRTDLVTRTELNQVMNRIVGMLERVAPGVSKRLPIPAQASGRAAAVNPQARKATSTKNQRRISGVVAWGDKSVVTVEFNGKTQRVYLGDTVGSTGWSLVQVEDTKATFRKNGEFKTVADGESFAF